MSDWDERETTDKLNGVVVMAAFVERSGDSMAGEAERVAELFLRYDDGTIVRLRAQSCGCCGGAAWDDVDSLARTYYTSKGMPK